MMGSKNRQILELWWPAFTVMTIIFIASSIPGNKMPDMGTFDFSVKKAGHALGYGFLAAAYLRALTAVRRASEREISLAAFLTLLYAISDECHQIFTPGRTASPFDVMIDMVGATIGLTVWVRMRRRAVSQSNNL